MKYAIATSLSPDKTTYKPGDLFQLVQDCDYTLNVRNSLGHLLCVVSKNFDQFEADTWWMVQDESRIGDIGYGESKITGDRTSYKYTGNPGVLYVKDPLHYRVGDTFYGKTIQYIVEHSQKGLRTFYLK